jgi:hypothetical protein
MARSRFNCDVSTENMISRHICIASKGSLLLVPFSYLARLAPPAHKKPLQGWQIFLVHGNIDVQVVFGVWNISVKSREYSSDSIKNGQGS